MQKYVDFCVSAARKEGQRSHISGTSLSHIRDKPLTYRGQASHISRTSFSRIVDEALTYRAQKPLFFNRYNEFLNKYILYRAARMS